MYVKYSFCLQYRYHKRNYKFCHKLLLVNVKWSRYRPGVAQRVGRVTALLFHDRGTRRGWVVSSTPRPHFTHGKDPVPIVQEAGWAPGPVWRGGKSRPHRDSIPDRPACSQSLYRLSYRAHQLLFKTQKYADGVEYYKQFCPSCLCQCLFAFTIIRPLCWAF